MSMNRVISGALSLLLACVLTLAGGFNPAGAKEIEQGKQVAFDRKKGNRLDCHVIAGDSLPGNIGPPLIAMKARFPKKADLRAQIWDPTVKNPHSIMPPFGKHRILTENEVDLVTEFIYSL